MSGSGFTNDIMHAENVDFSGGFPVVGQVVADGQLLIGSSVAPNIRVATLTSADMSVTITNGNGTIDLSAAGGGGGVSSVTTSNASIQFVNTLGVEDLDFGSTNLALGSPLSALTTGNQNAAFGYLALFDLTSGVQNTATGQQALQGCTTGYGNDAHGFGALASNISGNENAAFGDQALASNTGSNNTAMGCQALAQATSSNNTAVGYLAGRSISTGTGNVAVGLFAMVSALTANYSVAVGYQSLQSCTGDANTCVGANSGLNYTGVETNNICIGAGVFGTLGQSNSIQIGNGTETTCKIAGIAGVTVANQQSVVINSSTGQLGVAPTTLLSATITLTSAQVKNLNATPITIVAAPGAGKAIIPYSVVGKLVYGGSNVFVAAAAQAISLAYNTVANSTVLVAGSIAASASAYSFNSSFSSTNLAIASMENVALTAYNPVAVEISGNAADDNTVVITVQYYVVTM